MHLIAIRDQERLEKFLVEWEVFEHLFDEEYSYKLLQLWREVILKYFTKCSCMNTSERVGRWTSTRRKPEIIC